MVLYFIRQKAKLLCFLSIFLFPSLFIAQEKVFTYEDILSIAAEHNVEIKKEKNNLKINKAIKNQGVANLFPTLNLNGNAFKTEGLQWSDQDAKLLNTTISSVNYGINSELTIFNGFKKLSQLKQNKQLLIAQKEQIDQSVQDILLETSQQYLQILLDKEMFRLAETNFEVQKQIYEQIKLYVSLGKRASIELLSQEAFYKQSEASLIEMRNKLQLDKGQLLKSLVLELNEEYDIAPLSSNVNEIMAISYDFDLLLKEALDNRSDLKKIIAEKAAAFSEINISKSDNSPSISLFYSYGSNYSSNRTRIDKADNISKEISLEDQLFKENNYSRYGVNLKIPVFNGLRNRTNIVRSKVLYENLLLSHLNLERSIFIDLQNAIQNFNLFRENYIINASSVEVSQKSFEKQQELFRLGKGSLLNLNIEAQRNLQAHSQHIQALYTLLFQKMVVDYHLGNIRQNL